MNNPTRPQPGQQDLPRKHTISVRKTDPDRHRIKRIRA